jgi:transposase
VDIEPLCLVASETAGDGLKRLADLIEMVPSFPQTEVGEVVGAEFVAQERRELASWLPSLIRASRRRRLNYARRCMLRLHLQQIDAIDTAIAEIDHEVNKRIEPFRTAVELLTTIPGISELGARVIAPEIGNDMSRFATAAHLISWAAL